MNPNHKVEKLFSLSNIDDAKEVVLKAWPQIVNECRSVLGSELHYQAMMYHCLRTAEVPVDQLGMNVKMYIRNCQSELFKKLDQKKHKDYRGGFEPIPDVVIFSKAVGGDWRRRKNEQTLLSMLLAIEVKASERHKGRLAFSEIKFDIDKLAAHREEMVFRGSDFMPVMLVLDTAPEEPERMRGSAIEQCKAYSKEAGVGFMYCSPTEDYVDL